MCELFGFNGRRARDCAALLREFYTHGDRNPHGWGLAMIENGQAVIRKEPVPSLKSPALNHILSEPVWADQLMAHIRLATKGSIEFHNTHPFTGTDGTGRQWILQHNGTVFESVELSGYVRTQTGTTDSERILYYLTDCMDRAATERTAAPEKAGPADGGDMLKEAGGLSRNMSENMSENSRIRVVEELLRTITPENKINLMVMDGELLYVHTNYRGSLFRAPFGEGTVFSTRPLTEVCAENWQELPLNTLLVYKKGQMLYRGTDHGHEFLDSEEKMRFLLP